MDGQMPTLPNRSIPAWAGEPLRSYPRCGSNPVYPRVGGGTLPPRRMHWHGLGLSPRGRGNLESSLVMAARIRSIPAWAGEPSGNGISGSRTRVYPRVGGGTACAVSVTRFHGGLSPRGRGNRVDAAWPWHGPRSIPAWAGEPRPQARQISTMPVYPRVGGGTSLGICHRSGLLGLSPRGRGNPARSNPVHRGDGSIPAWAGEPVRTVRSGRRMKVYPRVGGGTPSLG